MATRRLWANLQIAPIEVATQLCCLRRKARLKYKAKPFFGELNGNISDTTSLSVILTCCIDAPPSELSTFFPDYCNLVWADFSSLTALAAGFKVRLLP
jgi:hypothetical protein